SQSRRRQVGQFPELNALSDVEEVARRGLRFWHLGLNLQPRQDHVEVRFEQLLRRFRLHVITAR
ncbi:MAG: hypothetical protein DMD90_29860, partial [Candidatus Rokuibacteriota bacterium]